MFCKGAMESGIPKQGLLINDIRQKLSLCLQHKPPGSICAGVFVTSSLEIESHSFTYSTLLFLG